jgi:hypothetical protein
MGTTRASAETEGAEKSVATKIFFKETPTGAVSCSIFFLLKSFVHQRDERSAPSYGTIS